MARSRLVRPIRSRSQRKSVWIPFVGLTTAVVTLPAASAVLFASLNAAALALRPFTIVRTRASLWTRSDQSAATEEPFGNLGIAVVSDQAVAIGVTAVPTPSTDPGSSLFFSYADWYAAFSVSTAVGFEGASVGSRIDIDSKAMRKVEIGQDVVITVENEAAAHGALFLLSGRILIKTN